MSPKAKTNRLSERAMLVHVRVSGYEGKKKDKKVTTSVLQQAKAKGDAGEWVTHLIPKNSLKPVAEARTRVRYTWTQMTLPWMDGGVRILPSARFKVYRDEMNKVIGEYNDRVTEWFRDEYPRVVAENKDRLAALGDHMQLPPVSELKLKFGVTHEMLPMPDVKDFRVQMGTAERDEVVKQVEESIREMTSKAMRDIWKNLNDLVTHAATILSDEKKIIRDSVLGNIKKYCELIPDLNIADDEELETVRKNVLAKLGKLKSLDLREDKAARKKAAKTAKEIIKETSKGISL